MFDYDQVRLEMRERQLQAERLYLSSLVLDARIRSSGQAARNALGRGMAWIRR